MLKCRLLQKFQTKGKKKSTYSPLLKKNHQCKLEREKVAEEVVVSQPFWEFAMGSALQPLVPTGSSPCELPAWLWG